MDMKEEMMSEAVDDVMEDEAEDEEEEGDKILREVLDEMGVGLQHQLTDAPTTIATSVLSNPQAIPVGGFENEDGGKGGFTSEEDALQARLDNLRRN